MTEQIENYSVPTVTKNGATCTTEQIVAVFGSIGPKSELGFLSKQFSIWCPQVLGYQALKTLGYETNVAEWHSHLATFVPETLGDKSGAFLAVEAHKRALTSRGNYYCHDGLKLANGQDVKNITASSIRGQLAKLTPEQKTVVSTVAVNWATAVVNVGTRKVVKRTIADAISAQLVTILA